MRDIVGSQKNTLKITLSLQRGNDTASRSFSVDNPRLSTTTDVSAEFQNRLQALRNFLLGEGNTLIQPTSWRDSDNTEEEWTTVDVQFQTTMAAIVDWGINKLSRTAHLYKGNNELTTLSAATLGTDVTDTAAEYQVRFDGAAATDIVYTFYQPATNNGELVFLMYDTPKTAASISNWRICIAKGADGTDFTGKLLFYIPATDTYEAATLEIPVTN